MIKRQWLILKIKIQFWINTEKNSNTYTHFFLLCIFCTYFFFSYINYELYSHSMVFKYNLPVSATIRLLTHANECMNEKLLFIFLIFIFYFIFHLNTHVCSYSKFKRLIFYKAIVNGLNVFSLVKWGSFCCLISTFFIFF